MQYNQWRVDGQPSAPSAPRVSTKEALTRSVPSRRALLQKEIAPKEVDAVLIGEPNNVRHASGFSGSLAYLLVSPDTARIITDSRYYIQARQQAADYDLVKLDKKLGEILKPILQGQGWRRLGFEAQHVSVASHEDLGEVLEGVVLVPLRGLVEDLRAHKDEHELALLRQAVAVGDAAFERFVEWVRPGVTEREAAWTIDTLLHECGGDEISFPTIVAAGENAAKPHAIPGDRPIGLGESVVLDFGCRLQGYCSDMTRTICLGQPGGKFKEVYDLVLAAQEAAERSLRAGMNGKEADEISRKLIEEAGMPAYEHGLGHGIGLAVHEEPRLSKTAEKSVIEVGMVVTVEPGIYLEDWGGVRIEDMGVLTPQGFENFTRSSKVATVSTR